MSPTALLVPTYGQMLTALSGWLDTAKTHATAGDAVMAARLAPDMLPLSAQVRFCCVQAHEGVCRLRGTPFGKVWQTLVDEGWAAPDHPGTITDAQARITEALDDLAGLAPDALDAGADRPITIELPGPMIFDMTGEQYARDWALPQLYFHLITAYGILRAQGVPLGKADYVPHAARYLRA